MANDELPEDEVPIEDQFPEEEDDDDSEEDEESSGDDDD